MDDTSESSGGGSPDDDLPGDDPFDPIAFLETAVATPSHEDVTAMRTLLVEMLESRGVEATVDGAGNVLATRGGDPFDAGDPSDADDADGSDDDYHLVLNTHVDTVSPHVPYERDGADAVDGGVIRGRGSCDAKGPLAVLLAAFLAVEPTDGRVTLAVTPDEETLSTGAAALVGAGREGRAEYGGDAPPLRGDAFVVGEPTGLDVCTAAKGRFEGTIDLSGVNAHAAEPGSGANAVAAVEHALRAVRTFDAAAAREATGEDVAVADDHPALGAATLTPTVVRGGEATNQVPADCRLTVDRRSVPPETAEGFRAALEAHVRRAVASGPVGRADGVDAGEEETRRTPGGSVGADFRLTERETPFLGAFATDGDHPLVRTLADAATVAADEHECPAGGDVRPFTAATEASYFAPAPTVVFGPGVLADDEGAVAHADREYVRVAEVRAAAAALSETVRALVG